jgi:hypothetical protein
LLQFTHLHQDRIAIMNSLRIARVALSARPSALRTTTLLKRTYADVAPDKIKLTLALPHQAIYKSQDVYVPPEHPKSLQRRRCG